MVANYFGERCFRFQSGDVSLLVDPNSNRLKADVVLKTITPALAAEAAPAAEISFPGEYEMKGMEIFGYPVSDESTGESLKTVYLVRWEGMSFVFVGHIVRVPEAEWISKIGEPDVLVLPMDGPSFLKPQAAAGVIRELAPRLTIAGEAKHTAEMLRALGRTAEAQDKFVFKRKDIEGDGGKVVLLRAA